jgi:hypothetical protein
MGMSESLQKKVTPTAAFRMLTAPYREKLEETDAERGKLEGRIRRSFDMFEHRMREIWGSNIAESQIPNGSSATESSDQEPLAL